MNVELVSAELYNFLSHKKTVINFERGITVLLGPNGAGKTSIIEAIAFALTGKALNRKELKELVNKQANTAIVRVRFKAYDNEYLIERKIVKTPTPKSEVKLYVRRGNAFNLYAMKKGEVERELRKILGVDGKVLRGIAFVAQGEVTKLLESPPSERSEIISKIAGITALKDAKERMRYIINFWKERKVEVEGEIKALKAKIKEREKLVSIIKRAKEEVERLEKELKEKEKRLEEIKPLLEVFDRNEKVWRTLNGKRETLINEISKIKEELTKLEGIDSSAIEEEIRMLEEIVERKAEVFAKLKELERKRQLESKLRDIKREIEALEMEVKKYEKARGASERYEELSKRLSALSNLLPYAKQAREILKRFEDPMDALLQLSAAEGELEEIEEKIDKLTNALGSLRRRIKEGEDKLRVLKEGDRCPVCGRPLTREHIIKIRNEIESDIIKAKEEMKRIENEIAELRKRRKALLLEIRKLEVLAEYAQALIQAKVSPAEVVRAEKEAEKIKKEMKGFEQLMREERKLEEVKRRLETLVKLRDEILNELRKTAVDEGVEREFKEIVKAEKRLKGLRKELERVKGLEAKREKLKVMLSNYEEELKEVEEMLRSINYDAKKHEEVREEYEILTKDVSSLQGKVRELRRKISELNEKVGEIEKLKSELKKMERESMKIAMLVNLLETIRRKLNEAQELTLERVRALTEKYMKEMIETFSFDFYDVNLDRTFKTRVITQRGEMEVSQLSGGEKVALGIALRLALAKALGERIGFIFLDEPTIHLDVERRRGLVDILRNISYDMPIAQMIVVTHDKELIDAADHVCEVEKVGEFSRVSCTSLT